MTQHPTFVRLRRWGTALAATVAAVAVATLTAWTTGEWEWLSLGNRLIPIAPTTAVVLLLLSVASLARIRVASGEAQSDSRFECAVSVLSLGILTLVVLRARFALGPDIELFISRTTDLKGSIPLGRMSFATVLLLAGLSLGKLLRCAGHRSLSIALFTIVSGAALVFLQGYVFGAPLLYDGRAIPISILASASVLLLGISGLLGGHGNDWPLRLFIPVERPEPGLRRALLVLAAALGATVLASGIFWFTGQRERAVNESRATLDAIAGLKAAEIGSWYDGQLSTGRALQAWPLSSRMLDSLRARYTTDPAALPRAPWLEALAAETDLLVAALFDVDGRLLSASSKRPVDLTALTAYDEEVRRLGRSRQIQAHDIEAHQHHKHIELWVPIHTADDAPGANSAWLLLSIDVGTTLYNIVQQLPIATASGEVTMWRIMGDTALALSPLRYVPDGALRFRAPVSETAVSLTRAADRVDSLDTRDYRGVPVVAAARRVAGTDWIVVAKRDRSEVVAPVMQAAFLMTFIALIVLLAIAASIYAMWSRGDKAQALRELSLVRAREESVEELRLSEARYARAMRGTSDGLWDRDLLNGTTYVSPRWREIMGIPDSVRIASEEEMQMSVLPEDAPLQEEAIRRHLTGGTPYDIELRVTRSDGEIRWVRTRGEAERDAAGRPIRMAGAISDVTDNRMAEEALARVDRILRMRSAVDQAMVRATSEQELLQAVCNTGVMAGGYPLVWIGFKRDDTQKSVDPVAMAGGRMEYLNDHPISWDERAQNGQGPTGRCIRSGEIIAAQNLREEQGFEVWRSAAAKAGFQSSLAIPIRAQGAVIGALMLYSAEPSAFDEAEISLLTELGQDLSFGISSLRDHLTLVAQQEQLTLFRQAIDQSSDAIFVADVATGRFVDFNAAALRELGYTADEMRLLDVNDIATEVTSRAEVKELAEAVRASGGLLMRSDHRRKDGSIVPTEIALSVIELGQRSVIVGIARNIADRLQSESAQEALEQQLARAQKLESIGRLAGGIAHDFNNLLTVINATTDLAIHELPDGSPMRAELGHVRAAGERAKVLTRQLLAFSRQQVLKREVLDVNQVATDFLAMLSRVIGEDIRVDLKLGDHVPSILADAGQLEQVLMNLCVNARDAMPHGGELSITTERLVHVATDPDDPHAMPSGEYASLSVRDTGIGMDAETVSKVFEPFFTTKEMGQGTGLGLATVYGIVSQSGGYVSIDSTLGAGTTVRVCLPRTARVTPVSTPVVSEPNDSRGQETILLAEDEDAIRMVATRVLERAGYTVLQASSGEDAISLLDVHGPAVSLLMTDIIMPGMTGIQLAREARLRFPNLKLLFASGYSADATDSGFAEFERWNFIAKPYGVQDLANEVRRILDT